VEAFSAGSLRAIRAPKRNRRRTPCVRRRWEWWSRAGSNRRPSRCERDALPAELRPHESRTAIARRARTIAWERSGRMRAGFRTADLRGRPRERQWSSARSQGRARTATIARSGRRDSQRPGIPPSAPAGGHSESRGVQARPSAASWALGSACSNCRMPMRSNSLRTRGVMQTEPAQVRHDPREELERGRAGGSGSRACTAGTARARSRNRRRVSSPTSRSRISSQASMTKSSRSRRSSAGIRGVVVLERGRASRRRRGATRPSSRDGSAPSAASRSSADGSSRRPPSRGLRRGSACRGI
jgi:hypothetical protein